MITNLIVLNGSGDTKITWDHTDPAKVAEARETVANLKAAGYSFFLVDGSPADEVASGQGMLIVRKMTVEELVAEPAVPESTEPAEVAQEAPAKRRGRPPKTPVAPQPQQNVVAVRPVRGG